MWIGRDAWVEVDTEKLKRNFMEVKRAVGSDVKICAVLKAQAYGLGGVSVAQIIEPLGADMFAVAVMSEALEIRKSIPYKDVLILGYVSEQGYDTAIKNDITLTMYREDAIQALEAHGQEMGMQAKVHIKVNTGMNRLGFLPTEESADAIARCFQMAHISIDGIFTHLATAEMQDKCGVNMQMDRFDSFLEMLRQRNVMIPTVHVASSPTLCDLRKINRNMVRDMVRPGSLLTGFYISNEVSKEYIRLQPCVKLKAKLGNVMPVKAGEGIGYCFSYRMPTDGVVGLLPMGFADGFTYGYSEGFFVAIRGYRCPIIGGICMDHCVIDISNVPNPQIGEEIVVYGDGIHERDGAYSIQEIADNSGIAFDEVITKLTTRLPRVYI